jgi:hypothetical protein
VTDHSTSHHAAAQRARLATLDPWLARQATLMTEDTGRDSLLAETRKAIRDLGLWAYHTKRSDGSDKGFLDLVVLGTRPLWRELKTETGKLTIEQLDVMRRLDQAGQDVDVWRPTDWYSGRITRELSDIRIRRNL